MGFESPDFLSKMPIQKFLNVTNVIMRFEYPKLIDSTK